MNVRYYTDRKTHTLYRIERLGVFKHNPHKSRQYQTAWWDPVLDDEAAYVLMVAGP